VARMRSTSCAGDSACKLQEHTAIGAFEMGIDALYRHGFGVGFRVGFGGTSRRFRDAPTMA
jgi:hypothetical protein